MGAGVVKPAKANRPPPGMSLRSGNFKFPGIENALSFKAGTRAAPMQSRRRRSNQQEPPDELPDAMLRNVKDNHNLFAPKYRDWLHEISQLFKPLEKGKWWAFAALSETLDDFERLCIELSSIIAKEVRLDDDRRLLPKFSTPFVSGTEKPLGICHVFRKHNIEFRVCSAKDEEQWCAFGDVVRSSGAVWKCHSSAFVPPLVCTVDLCGLRVLCSAYTDSNPHYVLLGLGSDEGSHRVQKFAPEASKIGSILNLKRSQLWENGVQCESELSSGTTIVQMQGGLRLMNMSDGLFPREAMGKEKLDDEDDWKSKVLPKVFQELLGLGEEMLPPRTMRPELIRGNPVPVPPFGAQRSLEWNDGPVNQAAGGFGKVEKEVCLADQAQHDSPNSQDSVKPPERESQGHNDGDFRQLKDGREDKKDATTKDAITKDAITNGRKLSKTSMRKKAVTYEQDGTTVHIEEASAHIDQVSSSKSSRSSDEAWVLEKKLHASILPSFARGLDSNYGEGSKSDLTGADLTYQMHVKGVPMRMMGKIFGLVKKPHVRQVILTEMVARLFKVRIRRECFQALIKGKGLSDRNSRSRVAWFLGLAFGDSDESDEMWDQVQGELTRKFKGFQNITPDQRNPLREWEDVASLLKAGTLHHRLAKLEDLKDMGDFPLQLQEEMDIVISSLQEATEREQMLRDAINEMVVHVRDQVDMPQLISRVVSLLGLHLAKGLPSCLEDLEHNAFSDTDILSLGYSVHTVDMMKYTDAVYKLLRTPREEGYRRSKSLVDSAQLLKAVLWRSKTDWLAANFYADAQLLYSEVCPVEERYSQLNGAFWSYVSSVEINPMHTQAIYDAGGALYDMLAFHNDPEAQQTFERLCKQFDLRRADSQRFYKHIKIWSDRLMNGMLEASPSKAHRLASRSGELLGEWLVYFNQHDTSVLRAANVLWAMELDYEDLTAALVCGRTCVKADAGGSHSCSDTLSALQSSSHLLRESMLGHVSYIHRSKPLKTSNLPSLEVPCVPGNEKQPLPIAPPQGGAGVLYLSQTPFISDVAAICVITNATNVRTVHMDKNENISGASLDALRRCHAWTIEDLHISRCSHLDSRGLHQLISEFGSLTSLSLTHLRHIVNDKLITGITQYLTLVTDIDLSMNMRLTDTGISALGDNCRELRSVKLVGLLHLSDAGMLTVVRKCRSLRSLTIKGCLKLTSASMAELPMRTHSFHSNIEGWTRPGMGKVEVVGASKAKMAASITSGRRQDDQEDVNEWAMLKSFHRNKIQDARAAGAIKVEEEEGDTGTEGIMLDWFGAMQLAKELLGSKEKGHMNQVSEMFLELAEDSEPVVSGVTLHRDRVTSYLLDGIDSRIILIDELRSKRDIETLFFLFSGKGTGSSSFGKGMETMDVDEYFMALRSLNIVPCHMSSRDAIHYWVLGLEMQDKERTSAKLDGNDIKFSAVLNTGPSLTELVSPKSFWRVLKMIAKNLRIHSTNITRISADWIREPGEDIELVLKRSNTESRGKKVHMKTMARSVLKQHRVRIYIGAIRIRRDHIVLNEGQHFGNITVQIISSFDPEIFWTDPISHYSVEIIQVGTRSFETYVFQVDEDFEIPMPQDATDFDHGAVYLSLIVKPKVDPSKDKGTKEATDGIKQVAKSGYMQIKLPQNPDTRWTVDWIEFNEFEGQRKNKRGEIAQTAEALEEERKKTMLGLLTLPPALRLGYGILGPRRTALHEQNARSWKFYHKKRASDRQAEEFRMLDPFYRKKKHDQMAQQAMEHCAEQCVEELFMEYDLFQGFDRFDELDCSNTSIGAECWHEILKCMKGFKSLILKNCREITDSAAMHIAASCPGLRRLCVANCFLIAPDTLDAVPISCVHLQDIDFSGLQSASDSTINNLLDYCKEIHTIRLNGCLRVTDVGAMVIARCSSLKKLKLGGCRGISQQGLVAISQGLAPIECLDLSDLESAVSDATVEAFLKHKGRSMHTLKLTNNSLLTANVLFSLARYGREIRKLNLSGSARFSDDGLFRVVCDCVKLRKLNLSGCSAISDVSMLRLSTHGNDLEELDIVSCSSTTLAARWNLAKALPLVTLFFDMGELHGGATAKALRRSYQAPQDQMILSSYQAPQDPVPDDDKAASLKAGTGFQGRFDLIRFD